MKMMNIEEFAKSHDTSIRTLRYYINLSLLKPSKEALNLVFDETCDRDWRMICRLKHCGLTLEEIRLWIADNLKEEVGEGVGEDLIKQRRISLLYKKAEATKQQALAFQKMIEHVNIEMESYQLRLQPHSQGSSLELLDIVCCPHCERALIYKDASLTSTTILSGIANCICGFEMRIDNGIFVVQSHDNRNRIITVLDHNRETYDRMSSEAISRLQVSFNWVMKKLKEENLENKIIFENAVDVINFLGTGIASLNPKAKYIVVDSDYYVLLDLKNRVESLSLTITILYIVCPSFQLPIRKKTVDYLLDYYTTEVLQRLNIPTLVEEMYPYLASGAHIAGVFTYLAKGYHTLQNNFKRYPESYKERFQLKAFQCNLLKNGIIMEDDLLTNQVSDASALDVYKKGDVVGDYCFFGQLEKVEHSNR